MSNIVHFYRHPADKRPICRDHAEPDGVAAPLGMTIVQYLEADSFPHDGIHCDECCAKALGHGTACMAHAWTYLNPSNLNYISDDGYYQMLNMRETKNNGVMIDKSFRYCYGGEVIPRYYTHIRHLGPVPCLPEISAEMIKSMEYQTYREAGWSG